VRPIVAYQSHTTFDDCFETWLRLPAAWLAFLHNVRSSLPHAIVRNGTPPFFTVPSYQIVVITKHPRGSVGLVFRLSFLAPYYDYYENVRDERNQLLSTSLEVSPQTRANAALVRSKLAEHFKEYRELSPKLGAVLLLDRKAGNLSPDETTLADAMFEADRSW